MQSIPGGAPPLSGTWNRQQHLQIVTTHVMPIQTSGPITRMKVTSSDMIQCPRPNRYLPVTNNACWNFQLYRSAALKKSTVAHLVKNLSAIYVTITVFTTVLRWTLSWARWIHFAPSNPIYSPCQARLQRRKASISFVMSACLSVRMEKLGSHWTDFHEIWSVHFENLSTKFKFHLNLTRTTGTLHVYIYAHLW